MSFPKNFEELEVEERATRRYLRNIKPSLTEEDFLNRSMATNAGLWLKREVFNKYGFEHFEAIRTERQRYVELQKLIDKLGIEKRAKKFKKAPNKWAEANRQKKMRKKK